MWHEEWRLKRQPGRLLDQLCRLVESVLPSPQLLYRSAGPGRMDQTMALNAESKSKNVDFIITLDG
eukprot:CAMPEP_0115079154 /NCGR_PEP_ID=MMETSP0227-20121206/17943_1 /TAXON_ID=89957 /ORGANISM="Polarella glacialis, Strain CCMP 1383" /LENGTH=65 /DNA_ID=CAMNT_0002466611 /DNA_START=186 /DNA_END=383 /DNA_ORIENTATION=+